MPATLGFRISPRPCSVRRTRQAWCRQAGRHGRYGSTRPSSRSRWPSWSGGRGFGGSRYEGGGWRRRVAWRRRRARTMTFAAPSALWLLLSIPLVFAAQLAARTNFNPRQRWLQTAIRSLLLACLALALARPVISTASSRESVIYLVDVSHSISSAAIESAARTIDELNQQLRPHHHKVIAFGADALPLDNTAALRALATI